MTATELGQPPIDTDKPQPDDLQLWWDNSDVEGWEPIHKRQGTTVSFISYGPTVPYFAWRPVNTRDAGWIWFKRICRHRVYLDVWGSPGPFWEYYRCEVRRG